MGMLGRFVRVHENLRVLHEQLNLTLSGYNGLTGGTWCVAQVQQIAGQLERSLAEAHGEKQRLEEANAEQAALIPALQQACKAAEGQVSMCTL